MSGSEAEFEAETGAAAAAEGEEEEVDEEQGEVDEERAEEERAILEIVQRCKGDRAIFKKIRHDYPNLVTKSETFKVKHTKLGRVLDRADGREFGTTDLRLLLDRDWEKIKARFVSKGRVPYKVLDTDGFRYDLANVEPDKWISDQFDILGREKGIKVPIDTEGNTAEIDPMVNLAISLSLTACRTDFGLVLWQPKDRKNIPAWNRVPDLMYHDFAWHADERARFLRASYRQWREFVCAPLRLQRRRSVVLPFAVDFIGVEMKEDEPRFTAEIDGRSAPKAIISIPGAAYIGWYSDMVPDHPDEDRKHQQYRGAVEQFGTEWCIPEESLDSTRVASLSVMLQKIKAMYDEPQPDAVVTYQYVLDLINLAEAPIQDDAEKESSDDVNMEGSAEWED